MKNSKNAVVPTSKSTDSQSQKIPLSNVERPIQQPVDLKEAKQREADKAHNPYPHELRD